MISHRKTSKVLWIPFVVVFALAGVLTGTFLFGGSGSSSSDGSGATNSLVENDTSASFFSWPVPQDLQELVNVSEAIVIASVTSEVETGEYGSTDVSGTESRPPPRTVAYTNYKLEIHEVLLDDGKIQSNPIWQSTGTKIQAPKIGEKVLFALNRDREDRYYFLVGPWALIHLDTAVPVIGDKQASEPDFIKASNAEGLLVELDAALNVRQPKSLRDHAYDSLERVYGIDLR